MSFLFGPSKKEVELRDPPLLFYPMNLEQLPTGEVYEGNERLPRIGEVLGMDPFAISTSNRLIKSINHASIFEEYNSRKTRIFIFAGPPGTGKTRLTRAIARETYGNSYVYHFDTGMLMNGNLRTNLNIAFIQLQNIATSQQESDERDRKGFSLRKKKEKKTLIVVMDEFETLALKKMDGQVSLDYEQFGAVDDMLKKFDQLKTMTTNIVFLFTTNYPQLMESAVLSRAEFVPFFPPDSGALKHLIIQHVSDKMYRMQDDAKVFDPLLIDTVKKYREICEKLSDAMKGGDESDITAAKKALGNMFNNQVEQMIKPAVDSAEGFSGRDIEKAIDGMVEEWVAQTIDAKQRNKGRIILRRSSGPGLIGGGTLMRAVNNRKLHMYSESGISVAQTALQKGF